MTTVSSAGGAIDVKSLAIQELLDLLPTEKIWKPRGETVQVTRSALEIAVLEELWSRHCAELNKLLRASIYADGSTLCPPQEPDKVLFHDEVITRARDALFRLTVRGELTERGSYGNFGSYLWRITFNKALDLRKELIAQGPITCSLEEGGNVPAPLATIDLTLGVRRILEEYCKESLQKAASFQTVMLKEVEEWTWEELAKELRDTRSLEAKIQQVRRFVQKDETELMIRLKGYSEPQRTSR